MRSVRWSWLIVLVVMVCVLAAWGQDVPVRTLLNTAWVNSVVFSPDGQTLASGLSDSLIKLWDTATGRELRTLTGHTGSVNSVAFSPDGRTLASGTSRGALTDDAIKLWDAATGRELRTLTGHTTWVNSVAFSPDGRTLASGSTDNTIKLWDVAAGREIRTLTGHTGWVRSVAFSPDGTVLASGSGDSTIKLWDVATGRVLRTLTGYTGGVLSVAFSPDGTILASGSGDSTIKLWDVERILRPNEPPVAQFSLTPTRPSMLDTLRFTDQSTDPDGEVVSWRWEFGDGDTSTLRNPTHQYTRKGTFTVRLTVTDDDGATDTTSRTITVVNLPPVASFTVALHIEPLGLLLRRREVTFDASDSYDPDGEIVKYSWDFGDGNTAEGRIVTHTYPEAGTYTVRLTVTDDDGMTDTTEQEVQVVPGGGGGPG